MTKGRIRGGRDFRRWRRRADGHGLSGVRARALEIGMARDEAGEIVTETLTIHLVVNG